MIDPARREGKDNIWLVGFSMGGLGSLLYLREHPEYIEGVCLIAPFLGDEEIIEEIQAAGGVRSCASAPRAWCSSPEFSMLSTMSQPPISSPPM